MLQTYKILSRLLDYPDEQLQKSLPNIPEELRKEALLNNSSIKKVEDFINRVEKSTLLEWQEKYTGIFDYASSTSLYIFDHIHGNSKTRGMAMVDLKQHYLIDGLKLNTKELPDYLPVILEFLANTQTIQQAADYLAEIVNVLKKIDQNLKDGKSAYHYLLEALIYLASKGKAEPLSEQQQVQLEQLKMCENCQMAIGVEDEENGQY